MAENTSQRSIWVTLGAALGTVVVILGIAAGPTAIGCISDQAGFSGCVRNRLADFGLLKQTPAEIEQKASIVTSTDAAPQTGSDTAATSADETPAEPAKYALSLGLVRAEPSGDLVIAGSAAPGDVVSIFANGELLGTTVAENSGDWVFVPDAPLATGGAEITVGVPATGAVAASSVVVVIQDDRKTEPLVVASAPGEASKVLQGLKAPQTADVVATEEKTTEETTTEVAATTEPTPVAPAANEPVAEPTTEPTAPIVVAEAEPDAAQPAASPATAPEATTPETATPVTAEAETPAVAPEATSVAQAEPTTPPAPVAEPPAVAAEPTPAPAQAVVVAVAPSIDAIEVDGSRNFFAGAGTDGATVRLYVDDQFVADTVVENGRWLVETADNYLTKKNQRVRVDALRDGTADVAGRAEVDFEIDLPGIDLPANPVVVADAGDPIGQINAAANDNAGAALAAPPTIGVATSTDVATQTDVATSPTTEVASTPEVAEATEAMDAAKPEEEAEVPIMTAVATGDDEAQRFASGKAIIRRGDNLWTIAGRVYGSGYRYTAIYQANRKQIQNPNLIYPGQVFELPTE